MQRFLVDVDSPGRVVRWLPRGQGEALGGRLLRLSSGEIDGEVVGVAKGGLSLDTGCAEDLVVAHPSMAIKHPRGRGSDAFLAVSPDDGGRSVDYYSRVDGLRFRVRPRPRGAA